MSKNAHEVTDALSVPRDHGNPNNLMFTRADDDTIRRVFQGRSDNQSSMAVFPQVDFVVSQTSPAHGINRDTGVPYLPPKRPTDCPSEGNIGPAGNEPREPNLVIGPDGKLVERNNKLLPLHGSPESFTQELDPIADASRKRREDLTAEASRGSREELTEEELSDSEEETSVGKIDWCDPGDSFKYQDQATGPDGCVINKLNKPFAKPDLQERQEKATALAEELAKLQREIDMTEKGFDEEDIRLVENLLDATRNKDPEVEKKALEELIGLGKPES